MKFLHLADLHIGKNVNGFSMLEEQRHAFRQIIAYIGEHKPEAIVIAGDVFDRSIPGIEAVSLFDDLLTDLARLKVPVLLIAGNHDSPERLGFASRLLSEKHLYICGTFSGQMESVSFTDAYGPLTFWLLPFVKPASLRGLYEDREIDSYDDAIRAVLEHADIDWSGRNVLITHQFYTRAGVEAIRSESELSPVGGLDAVSADLIRDFDYAAIGHLHGAQTVGLPHLRYAGSPVKYSFSEWRQEKSVSLVEMKEKGRLSVRALPLVPLHDMREIRGPLDTLISSELVSLADPGDYLRVILTDEQFISDPMGKLKTVYPNVMSLTFDNARTRAEALDISYNHEEDRRLSPYELFSDFFLKTQGSVMSDEQLQMVREMLEGVSIA